MVIRRKTSNANAKEPVQFWLLVAASCLALACGVLTVFTGTVQADAVLSRPAATNLPAAPTSTPTPVMTQKIAIAPKKSIAKIPARMLRGAASWYGSVFNGRKTASGETFDMYAMTACHPTLPFGTKVRVVDLANHKSVVVRITDRGDLLNKRIIDLSYAAAEKLEMTKGGLAQVKLEVLSLGHLSEPIR
jgi:rare lipoprotein A